MLVDCVKYVRTYVRSMDRIGSVETASETGENAYTKSAAFTETNRYRNGMDGANDALGS